MLGSKCHLVTTGGMFEGTIAAISENIDMYELHNVTFRPLGNYQTKITMQLCEVYTDHIVASLPVPDE